MPARPSHLPTHHERTALQKMGNGKDWTAAKLEPVGHSTLEKMLAKGWIERTPDQMYRITSAGSDALRTELPVDPKPASRLKGD